MGPSPGRAPVSWQGMAYHADPESENPIHQDRPARRHGFEAGLVPGATIYAYLVHPALVAWGEPWLSTGHGKITLHKPFYDGERLTVKLSQASPAGYSAELVDKDGTVRASGEVHREAPDDEDLPTYRGAKPAPEPHERPTATPETLRRLQSDGLGSCDVPWRGVAPYERYLHNGDAMPSTVRVDQFAFANPSFAVNAANALLMANVRLGPWLHLESDVQHHATIALGRTLHVEGEILDVFEKGGHQLVDFLALGFRSPSELAVTIRHRAIYQLRDPR